MKLLFNKQGNGQEEITNLLGFLSADFSFKALRTDIELNTPDLIKFISSEVYNDIVVFYEKGESKEIEQSIFERILDLARLYISIMAYCDFSANNDLMHTTAGRKMNKSEDEATPWDWQIAADNAALKKRAYKALDQLIATLDSSGLKTWYESKAYKESKSLFVHNIDLFEGVPSINNSVQLYFRLVPFMRDFELEEIWPILGEELFKRLKSGNKDPQSLSKDEKRLLINVQKAIVYLTLAKAYKVLPIEMFPNKLNYREKTKAESLVRAEITLFLEKEAKKRLQGIEGIILELTKQSETTTSQNLLFGLKESNKYVDL